MKGILKLVNHTGFHADRVGRSTWMTKHNFQLHIRRQAASYYRGAMSIKLYWTEYYVLYFFRQKSGSESFNIHIIQVLLRVPYI